MTGSINGSGPAADSEDMGRHVRAISGERAFTLPEMLVCALTVAVLVMLALRFYRPLIEHVRVTEALVMLGAIHDSEYRYFTEHDTFTDNIERLDFDPYAAPVGRQYHFDYKIAAGDDDSFTAVATRKRAAGSDGGKTVTIDEGGNVGGTMMAAPLTVKAAVNGERRKP